MKIVIHAVLMCLGCWSAFAQGFLVVPNSLNNLEGNSSETSPFTSSSFRMQIVFDASQFGGQSIRIDNVGFRIDGASSGDVLYSFGGSTIQMSTTTRSPDGLSSVFSDNIGTDVRTIYNGSLEIGAGYHPGANPQPFGQDIIATSSFIYNPTMGNLLLDIRGRSGQTLFPGAMDAQSTVGDSISRVFATSELSTSGSADSLGLVTQFGYTVVPEPSVCILAVLGLAVSLAFRRRRK